jgi:hypothetical protein
MRGFGVSESLVLGDLQVSRHSPSRERRKWTRLQLAIPVFVRGRDDSDKEHLEFATAVNISSGGAMVVVRRALPCASAVSLEIPSVPLGPGSGLPRSFRTMRAKTVWITHLDGYHLLGLKFARPIGTDSKKRPSGLRRKATSAV